MNKLSEIIAKYNQSAEKLEFELRFGAVRKDNFVSVVKSVMGDATVAHTLNAISNDTTGKHRYASKIRTIAYKAGQPTNTTYTRKYQAVHPVRIADTTDYTINLNVEQPIASVTSAPDAIVRFKSRISSVVGSGRWRLDATAVRQAKLVDVGQHLKTIAGEMFTNDEPSKYLACVPFDLITGLEIEAEYIGEKPLLPEYINEVVGCIVSAQSETYQAERKYKDTIVALANKLLDAESLQRFQRTGPSVKRLINNPIACTPQTYNEFVWSQLGSKNIYITEKADGKRCVVWGDGSTIHILTDELTTLQYVGTAFCFDAELLVETSEIKVFDVMLWDEKLTSGWSKRTADMTAAVSTVAEYMNATSYKITPKEFIHLAPGELAAAYDKVTTAVYGYKTDGIMFVVDGEPYHLTTWLKWKPLTHNTIDFMLVLLDGKVLGVPPYIAGVNQEAYVLCCGINADMRAKLGIRYMRGYKHYFPDRYGDYEPIQFTPSARPDDHVFVRNIDGKPGLYDGLIVEMVKEDGRIESPWSVMRVRADRTADKYYFGNDYKVAELTYQSYMDPLSIADMVEFSAGYFKTAVADKYKNKNGFFRFVISTVMREYTVEQTTFDHVVQAVDLASGRGADLHRFQMCEVERALFVDCDTQALSELITRKFQMLTDTRKQHLIEKQKSSRMIINVMATDLNSPYTDILTQMKAYHVYPSTAQYVNCSFALHYFCVSSESLANFMTLVSSLLVLGGYFTSFQLRGENVPTVMLELPTSNPKYVVVPRHAGGRPAVGKMIDVKLPFTDDLMEEPLAYVSVLSKAAAVAGLELIADKTFDLFLPAFKLANRTMHDALDAADIEFSKLHTALVFKKIKNKAV